MVLLRKEEYPEINSGAYIGQLIEVKETKSKRNPQFGPSIRFAFRILHQPYLNAVVSGLTSAKLLTGNKLDKWLQGLGYDLKVKGELDTEGLVGKIANIYVERAPNSNYSNVQHINPLQDGDSARIDPKAKLVDTSAASQPAPQVAPVNTAVAPVQNIQGTGVNPPAPQQTPTPAPAPAPAPQPAPQPPVQPQQAPVQPAQQPSPAPRNLPF